jgi:hypothetical protein
MGEEVPGAGFVAEQDDWGELAAGRNTQRRSVSCGSCSAE